MAQVAQEESLADKAGYGRKLGIAQVGHISDDEKGFFNAFPSLKVECTF